MEVVLQSAKITLIAAMLSVTDNLQRIVVTAASTPVTTDQKHIINAARDKRRENRKIKFFNTIILIEEFFSEKEIKFLINFY